MLKMFRRVPMSFAKVLGPPTVDDHWGNVSFLMNMNAWNNVKDGGAVSYVGYPNIVHTNDPVMGRAIDFNVAGGARAIFDTNHANMGAGDFTIEAYVKILNGTTGVRMILGTRNGPGNSGFNLYMNSNRQPVFTMYTQNSDSNGVYTLSSPTAMAYDTWYHLAVSRIGNSVVLFVDGVPMANTNVTVAMFGSSGGAYIGGHNYGGSFDTSASWLGRITNVRLTKGYGRYSGAFTSYKAQFPTQ